MANNPANFQTKSFLPIDATIAIGQQVSNVIDVRGLTGVGLFVPDGMTSTEITFSVSYDNVEFFQLRDADNDPISQTISVSRGAYWLPPPAFFPWNYLKLSVDTAEAAERVIKVMPGNI